MFIYRERERKKTKNLYQKSPPSSLCSLVIFIFTHSFASLPPVTSIDCLSLFLFHALSLSLSLSSVSFIQSLFRGLSESLLMSVMSHHCCPMSPVPRLSLTLLLCLSLRPIITLKYSISLCLSVSLISHSIDKLGIVNQNKSIKL